MGWRMCGGGAGKSRDGHGFRLSEMLFWVETWKRRRDQPCSNLKELLAAGTASTKALELEWIYRVRNRRKASEWGALWAAGRSAVYIKSETWAGLDHVGIYGSELLIFSVAGNRWEILHEICFMSGMIALEGMRRITGGQSETRDQAGVVAASGTCW